MNLKENPPISSCQRCGTCCSKGGPALHDPDIEQVESGRIPLSSLYTIRKGELARDNISGGLICVDNEIIKIKSIPDFQSCLYYDDESKACRIYDDRPFECRELECWDTGAIVRNYSKNRLTRKKVLKDIQWILEIVDTHEARCSFEEIRRFADLREKGDPKGAGRLQEIVNDDSQFRYLLTRKGNISSDMLDFLLGRPLAQTINRQFGIKVEPVDYL